MENKKTKLRKKEKKNERIPEMDKTQTLEKKKRREENCVCVLVWLVLCGVCIVCVSLQRIEQIGGEACRLRLLRLARRL